MHFFCPKTKTTIVWEASWAGNSNAMTISAIVACVVIVGALVFMKRRKEVKL